MTTEQYKIIKINATACLWIFNDYQIQLVACHISNTRPKQFEDNFIKTFVLRERLFSINIQRFEQAQRKHKTYCKQQNVINI